MADNDGPLTDGLRNFLFLKFNSNYGHSKKLYRQFFILLYTPILNQYAFVWSKQEQLYC